MSKKGHRRENSNLHQLLWTDDLQHANVLQPISYPSWLWLEMVEDFDESESKEAEARKYDEFNRRCQALLGESWNAAVRKLRNGRYADLKEIRKSLQEREVENRGEILKLIPRIRNLADLEKQCRGMLEEYGGESYVGELLPFSEGRKADHKRWGAVYPEGIGSGNLQAFDASLKQIIREQKEKLNDREAIRQEIDLRTVYVELRGNPDIKNESIPSRERFFRFSADTTWKVALEKISSRLRELSREKGGRKRLMELLAFRKAVLQNVICLSELFGTLPFWKELTKEEKERISAPVTYKSKYEERKHHIVDILLERKGGKRVRRSKWKDKSPTDLMAEVENIEGSTANTPGETAMRYMRRNMRKDPREEYPSWGDITDWFERAEKWAEKIDS